MQKKDMLLYQHLCRGAYLTLLARQATLYSTAMPGCGLWVKHRASNKISSLESFFSTFESRLLLFGTNEIPHAEFVRSAQGRGFWLAYPDMELKFQGKSGPPTHRRRFSYLSPLEYHDLCCIEETIAQSIQTELTHHRHVISIVPNEFIQQDSVPHRLSRYAGNVHTMTVGSHPGFVGEYVLISPVQMPLT